MPFTGRRAHPLFLCAVLLLTAGCVPPDREKPATPLAGVTILRPPHEVSALAIQGDILWAGGREGLWRIHRKQAIPPEKLKPPRPLTFVKALLVDQSGRLWIGSTDGLAIYHGGKWRYATEEEGLPDHRVNCLHASRDGRIWIGTWGGAAFTRDGESFTTLTRRNGLPVNMVSAIGEDLKGGMWFGSAVAPAGGLTRLEGKAPSVFSTRNGLPHNNVNTLYLDRGGDVWAATGLLDRGGMARLTGGKDSWRVSLVLTEESGLAGPKGRSVFQDSTGVYWFGSEYHGIALWNHGRWTRITKTDGLAGNEAKVFLEDRVGTLWIATENGVTRMNGASLSRLRAKVGETGDR